MLFRLPLFRNIAVVAVLAILIAVNFVRLPDSGQPSDFEKKQNSDQFFRTDSFHNQLVVDRKHSPLTTVESPANEERLNEWYFRRVEIVGMPGFSQRIRREQVFYEDPSGQRTLKSEQAYAAGEILLGITANVVPSELEDLGNVTPLYPKFGLAHYLLTLPDADKDSVSTALEILRGEQFSGLLRFAEPNWLVHSAVLPNDPSVQNASQWAVRDQSSGSDINAEIGWDIRTDASSVVVAIVDTGILETHEDLASNMWTNSNEIAGNGQDDDNNGVVDDVFGFNAILNNGNITDDNGHGTHVAGTIGAAGNNGLGTAGVGWSVQLMAVKSLNKSGSGLVSDIAEGVLYAVDQGAHVVNTSFGSPVFNTAIRDTISYAEENNVLVVAAAGNEGKNNDLLPSYPASYDLPNIVSVASLDRFRGLSSFSNYGKKLVDIAAPGGGILSTYNSGNSSYATLDGTSMAAPHVSGVIALLIQEYPGENYSRYIDRLYQGGSSLETLAGTVSYSSGLDMAKSLLIQNPPEGLRFTSQMPNPLIRFQLQDLQLETLVESETGANYSWEKDGNLLVGTDNTLLLENLKINDTGIYSLVVEKEGQQIRDVSRLTVIAQSVGLSAAIESPLTVGTESQYPWTTTSEASTHGSTSLFSAPIGNNSSSSVYSYASGPGNLSFDWKVSSESGYDFLEFLVNGEVLKTISGESSWSTIEINLDDQDLKILQWRYTKDDSVSVGLDRGYLDRLAWNQDVSGLPFIAQNPESLILSPGENALLSVVARGEDLEYQWFKDGLEISGGIEAELSLTNVSTTNSGSYQVEVYNQVGSVLSQFVEVKVGDFQVEILRHPAGRTILEGLPVQLNVVAFGSPPIQYQWYKDDVLIAGATDSLLAWSSPTPGDSGTYHVAVTNAFSPNGVQSETASLIVQENQVGPSIVKQSFNLFVPEGQPAKLFVDASGTGPLNYQWYFNDQAISGASQSILSIERVLLENTGTYHCVVSNLVGEIRSANMLLSLQGNLGDAIEQPLLDWGSNNEANVRQQADTSHDGEDALAIFSEPNHNLTWVRTWVEGPAEISFWYALEGRATPASGRLFFLVDGVAVEELPNIEVFADKSFTIEEPGLHEIRWSHLSLLQPLNAYIDELTVTPVTLIKNVQTQVIREVGESYSIELDFRSSQPFSIEWYNNDILLGGESGPELSIDRLDISDSGIYKAKLINNFGSFWSPQFRLVVRPKSIPNATVVFSGIKFEANSPDPWISQSEEIFEGPLALMSPRDGFPTITTSVQGPISGVFYSKGLGFFGISPSFYTRENVGNGWTKTIFDLSNNSTINLTWRKSGSSPGYLEGLEFLPFFTLKSYRTGFSEVTQNSILRVEIADTGGVSFQWFKDGAPIIGANEEFYIVYYEDVEDVSTFHVEVSTGSVTRRGKDMVISRLDPEPGQEIIHVDGLFLQTGEDDWKLTDIETTALDGLSLHPGTLGESDTRLRSLFFGVSGPGMVSFRLKMGSDAGSLILRDSADNTTTYESAEDWTLIEVPADGPFRYEFDFSHQPTGSETYTEIPIFIDDLQFTSTGLNIENVEDEYVTLGAPFRKQIEVPWENGFTIEWFKNGSPLSQFNQETELIIPSVTDSDEANYSIELIGPLGETLFKEFSLFPQDNLYSEGLDSDIAYWRLSNPKDWIMTDVPDTTDGQALVSSFDRFSFEETIEPSEEPSIRIQPLFSGPGTLFTSFKFSNDVGTARLLIFEDGELIAEFDTSPTGWEEFQINIDGPASPEIQFVVQASSDFGINPGSLIIDSIRFEPGERVIDNLKSKFGNVGEAITVEVDYGIPGTELYSYSVLKANEEVMKNSSGEFVFNNPRANDFGNYILEIEDEKGITSEHPFQLINAASLGERFSSTGYSITGEGDPMVETETIDDSGHSNVARINPRSSEIPTVLEVQAQGPLTVQFDYKNLYPEGSGTSAVFKINGVVRENLASSNWKQVNLEYDQPFNSRLEWFMEVPESAEGEGWLFDNLIISQRPVIQSNPQGISVLGGSPVLLSANVAAGQNAKFSWIHKGETLPGIDTAFLPIQDPGSDSAGNYFLRIQDNLEVVTSQGAQVQFQDNIPGEFPPQSWNRYVRNRGFVGFSQTAGIDGGPALYFLGTGGADIKPAVGFQILGPRQVEFLGAAPGTARNEFETSPEPAEFLANGILAAGWSNHSFLLESPIVHNVEIEYASRPLAFSSNYDTTTGWIDKLNVSWIEGHPFTEWIIEHFPEEYETITDFELLFGDRDKDGITNYMEFATFSSPNSSETNFWLTREQVEIEIGTGGVFTPGFNRPPSFRVEERSIFNFHAPEFNGPQFHYKLQFSQNLTSWDILETSSTNLKQLSEGVVLVQMIITDDQIDPERPLFFRLTISSELYEQLNE